MNGNYLARPIKEKTIVCSKCNDGVVSLSIDDLVDRLLDIKDRWKKNADKHKISRTFYELIDEIENYENEESICSHCEGAGTWVEFI